MFEIILTFSGSLFVGVLGGLLGIGGGVFLVPFLVIVGGLEPISAVGISLFSVIGTSLGSNVSALKSGRANVGLSLLFEPSMLITSVAASLLAQKTESGDLMLAFAALMFGLGVLFFLRRNVKEDLNVDELTGAERMTDAGFAVESGQIISYRPKKTLFMSLSMALTGAASGFFGIGGGAISVPVMTLIGKVPLRAATSTSTLAMSVTGAVAGFVHLLHGTVPAVLVGASLLGVIPGGQLGSKIQAKLSVSVLRTAFSILAVCISVATVLKVYGVIGGK